MASQVTDLTGATRTPKHVHRPLVVHDTGMWWGGLLSIGELPGQITISAGEAQVLNPTSIYPEEFVMLAWPEITVDVSAISDPIASGVIYIGLQHNRVEKKLEVVVRDTEFSHPELTSIIRLGRCGVDDGELTTVVQEHLSVLNRSGQSRATTDAIGPIAVEGLRFRPDALLVPRVTAGRGFRLGANYSAEPHYPNTLAYTEDITTPSIVYVRRDGSGGWVSDPAAAINPLAYDDGSGTLKPLSATRWSIQQVYFSVPTGILVVQYGQASYQESELLQALMLGGWDYHPTVSVDLVRIAVLLIRSTCINLADKTRCKIAHCNRFGGLGGR